MHGIILHEEYREWMRKLSHENLGKLIENMFRVDAGEDVEKFGDDYLDFLSETVCGRVSRDIAMSDKQRANRLGKTKNNQTITKNNQKKTKQKPNDNQTKTPITNNLLPITNNQLPITNNSPTGNIEKEIDKERYGEFDNVLLTIDEYMKLKDRFPDYQERIENLSQYMARFPDKAKTYKSHYATILAWSRKDEPKKKSTTQALDNWLKGVT